MSTNTVRPIHTEAQQQNLERKLKKHLAREFNLGERVIALLKQKKSLETDLQQQLQAKGDLERKLEVMLISKHKLEQQFQQTQKVLQEKQKSLRNRSRMIIESEEDSRGSLELLRQKICTLEQQLQAADAKKFQNHIFLSKTIRDLREKEQHLSRELKRIAHQRDIIERQLHKTIHSFRELSDSHKHDKASHEHHIKKLLNTQIEMEARIKRITKKQKTNEQTLQEKIRVLRASKTQLESKVKQLEQQHSEVGQQLDSELLQVMEKQDQYIQELKNKAHERSTMLKNENEVLRQELEGLMSSQEQVKWENQMLESSLKGLQTDLAEYLQLKNRFEEAQKEKEHFEEVIRRKFQFLQNCEVDEEQDDIFRSKVRIHEQKTPAAHTQDANKTSTSQYNKKTELVRNIWMVSNAKLLTAVIILLILVSIVALIMRLAFQDFSGQSSRQGNAQVGQLEELPVIDLPDDAFSLDETRPRSHEESGKTLSQHPQDLSVIREEHVQQPSQEAVIQVAQGAATNAVTFETPVSREEHVATPVAPTSDGALIHPPESSTVQTPQHVRRPVDIVVRLAENRRDPYLSRVAMSVPTAENNVVLRRHYHPTGSNN